MEKLRKMWTRRKLVREVLNISSSIFFLFFFTTLSQANHIQWHFVISVTNIDCLVAVLSKSKTWQRGESLLFNSKELCCSVTGERETKPSAPPAGPCWKGSARRKDVRSSKQRTQLGGSESTQNTRERKWVLFANRRSRKGGGSSRERQAESQGP